MVGDLARGRLQVPSGPSVTSLTGFCLAAVAATALSQTPFVSLLGAFMRREGLLSLLAYAGIYFLVLRLAASPERVRQGMIALLVPVLPTGAYAVAQTFGFEFVRELNPAHASVRAYGFLGNADFLGVYAAMMLPIAVAAFVRLEGGWRVYAGMAIYADILALLFSYFRGGWLGAAVGLGVLTLLLGAGRLRQNLVLLGVGSLIAATAMATAFGLRSVQPKPAETGFAARAASVTQVQSGTAATRLDIWPRAAGLLAKRPVFGFGPEAFRGQFMPIRGEKLVRLEGAVRWDRPHNALLYLASSVGLLGLGCYLVFFGSVLAAVVKSVRAGSSDAVISAGLVGGAAAAFAADLFLFWSPATTPIVFAALGLAMASARFGSSELGGIRRIDLPPAASVIATLLVISAAVGVLWVAVSSLRGDYYAELGRRAKASGQSALSTFYYGEAVAASPWVNDYRWRAARGWEQAGFSGANENDLAVAAGILKEGLRYDPFDEQAYVLLGDIYKHEAALSAGETARRMAQVSYEKALRLDPYSPPARAGLARLLFGKGEYKRAIEEARIGLDANPLDKDLLIVAGLAYERTGDIERSRASFLRVLKLDPKNGAAMQALTRLGRP